jgi:hypothetical protein
MRKRMWVRPSKPARNLLYQCERCGATEHIPTDVLAYFDAVDPGNPGEPATFQCQLCDGIMYPAGWFRAQRATP